MRLKKHSEKTDDAGPKREQDQRREQDQHVTSKKTEERKIEFEKTLKSSHAKVENI